MFPSCADPFMFVLLCLHFFSIMFFFFFLASKYLLPFIEVSLNVVPQYLVNFSVGNNPYSLSVVKNAKYMMKMLIISLITPHHSVKNSQKYQY